MPYRDQNKLGLAAITPRQLATRLAGSSVTARTPAGLPPNPTYWDDPGNHALAWRIDGTEFGDPTAAIYLAYNGWSGNVTFTLPTPPPGNQWHRVTDTSTWAEGTNQVRHGGRAVLVLIAR